MRTHFHVSRRKNISPVPVTLNKNKPKKKVYYQNKPNFIQKLPALGARNKLLIRIGLQASWSKRKYWEPNWRFGKNWRGFLPHFSPFPTPFSFKSFLLGRGGDASPPPWIRLYPGPNDKVYEMGSGQWGAKSYQFSSWEKLADMRLILISSPVYINTKRLPGGSSMMKERRGWWLETDNNPIKTGVFTVFCPLQKKLQAWLLVPAAHVKFIFIFLGSYRG